MDTVIETSVLTKLRRLPEYHQQEVLLFVEFLENKLQTTPPKIQEKLAAAAQTLLADYETDEELTAFTALDGDDFYISQALAAVLSMPYNEQ